MELYETLCDMTKKLFADEDLSNLDNASDKAKEVVGDKVKEIVERKISRTELDTLENYIITNRNDTRLAEMAEHIAEDIGCEGLAPCYEAASTLDPKYCAGMLLVMHKYLKEQDYNLDNALETVKQTMSDSEVTELIEDIMWD